MPRPVSHANGRACCCPLRHNSSGAKECAAIEKRRRHDQPRIAHTTLRKVVGQHTQDEALSETDVINVNIQKILDVATRERGWK